MSETTHVFVGLIARQTITVATAVTLFRLGAAAREKGIRVSLEIEETGGIALGRNLLTERFLDGARDAQWFLSLDDDIGRFTATDLERMIKHGVDVVGAPLPGRSIEPHTFAHALRHGLSSFEETGNLLADYNRIHSSLSERIVKYIDRKPRWVNETLVEVESTSAGCLLISRRAIEQLAGAGGRFLFNARKPPRVWEFTEEIPDDSYSFCKKWRAMGGRVYVDALASIMHMGVTPFLTKPLAELHKTGELYDPRGRHPHIGAGGGDEKD